MIWSNSFGHLDSVKLINPQKYSLYKLCVFAKQVEKEFIIADMSELTVASHEAQKLLHKYNLKVRKKCQKTICKCHTTKPV